ncbi:MAG: hypothetical protein H0T62_08945 [Parachlamydiaceae bacterium]|nr:hypothetical protein [Parachlamydiaceae bacterium]
MQPIKSITEGVKFFAEHTISTPPSISSSGQDQKGLLNFCKRLNNIERDLLLNALHPTSTEQNSENNEITQKLIIKLIKPDTSELSSADSAKNKMRSIWDKISGKKHVGSNELAQQLLVWADRNKPEYTETGMAARDLSKPIDQIELTQMQIEEHNEAITFRTKMENDQIPPMQILELEEVNDLKRILSNLNKSSRSNTPEGWIYIAGTEDKLLEKINTIVSKLDKANKEGKYVEGIDNLTAEIGKMEDIQKEVANSISTRVSPQQKIMNQKNKIEERISKLDKIPNYNIGSEKQKISLEIADTINNAQELQILVKDEQIKEKIGITNEEITNLEEIIQFLNESNQKMII